MGKLLYGCGYWLSRAIARGAFGLRVEGVGHVPRTGPVILAPNHVSYVDPMVVGCAAPRPVHFMAKRELFDAPVLGWLIRHVNAYPVSRQRLGPSTLKHTLALLAEGQVVAIFPEGTRGDGARLGPIRAGIGVVAARAGAPVVPVFHAGTERVLPRGARRVHRARIWVRFGAPLEFGAGAGPAREELEEFGRVWVAALEELRSRGRPTQPGIH